MQTILSKIRTRFTNSISYDDNRYAKRASQILSFCKNTAKLTPIFLLVILAKML